MSAAAQFPPDFTWGVATAAYQIEGAVREDGRGPSIWDTFSHTPGKVAGGDTGDVACDHYHRWQADLDIMAQLGVDSYRFSVAWSRIQPDGVGPWNQAGLDFYDRLVDGLAARGIKPAVTLYHWDLPQHLEDLGGWPARDTAARFADYAEKVAATLGDRVWMYGTLNEPWCAAFLGYGSGVHAPGRRDNAAALAAAHHLNLAHGLAAQAIRAGAGADAAVSITLNPHVHLPATDSEEDRDAARQVDAVGNRVFLGPLLEGAYPQDLLADTAHITDWSFVRDGDLAVIRTPLAALGLNYYATSQVRARRSPAPAAPSAFPGTERTVETLPPTGPLTDMGWNIDPAGLTWLLTDLGRRYPEVPLLITENGAAFQDRVEEDGSVHDAARRDYFARHLHAVKDALDAGVNVSGYFAWSLLDNFEWAFGYSKRFGLVHVDYATQARRLKDSALWFRDVVASGRVPELPHD